LGQLYGGWQMRWLGIKLIAGGEPAGRMSSAFMYANIFAAYLLIAFILGLGLAIDAYRMDWRVIRQKQGRRLLFLSLTLIMVAIGLILTDSRNAWGLALLACLAFALYSGWRWLVVAIGLAAGSVAWAAWGPAFGRDRLRQLVPSFLWARLSDELYARPEITLRTTQWQFAWEMVQQRPWLGWGLRNFSPLYKAEMGVWLGHPHNFCLMLLAEAGTPATLILCGLVGWVIFRTAQLLMLGHPLASPEGQQRNHLLLFTYFLAFGSCCLFNLFDVTIFDLRLNILGWLLLSAMAGIVYRAQPYIFND
jgi:O-antigen ligase